NPERLRSIAVSAQGPRRANEMDRRAPGGVVKARLVAVPLRQAGVEVYAPVDARENERAGVGAPGVVGADELARSVGVGEFDLADGAEGAEGACELHETMPPDHVVHSVAE